jgi:hypothetical protein
MTGRAPKWKVGESATYDFAIEFCIRDTDIPSRRPAQVKRLGAARTGRPWPFEDSGNDCHTPVRNLCANLCNQNNNHVLHRRE